LFLAVLVWCVLATLLDYSLSKRDRPGHVPVLTGRVRAALTALTNMIKWGCVVLLAVAMAVAWFAGTGDLNLTLDRSMLNLPWLSSALDIVFVTQAVLVLLIALVTVVQVVVPRQDDSERTASTSVVPRRAWFGMALPVVVVLAWLIAGGFAGALTVRAADLFGTPQATGSGGEVQSDSILLPVQYFWVAVAASAAVALIVLAALIAILLIRLRRRAIRKNYVDVEYKLPPEEEDLVRSRAIANTWAWASATDIVGKVIGFFAWAIALGLAAGIVWYFNDPTWPADGAPGWLVTGGSLVMAAAVGGLL